MDPLLLDRPNLPGGLGRIVRLEFVAMEFEAHGGRITRSAWWVLVLADPHRLTAEDRARLGRAGWSHYPGRNSGTFRKKVEVEFCN